MKTFAIRSAVAAFSILALAGTASAASMSPMKPTASKTNIELAHHIKRPGHVRGHRILSPRKVVRALQRQGYHHVRRISFSKGKYYAIADGRRGPVKLAINARSGHVIGRSPLRKRHGSTYHGGRNGFSWSFSVR